MEKLLSRLPDDILRLVHRCRATSSDAGIPAYLVGGFVRDLLLARANYDLDICVEGAAVAFAARFAAGMNGRLVSHSRFGTATFAPVAGVKLDFATARKETYPRPAALPVVSPGTIEDDLFRRDFTINTLAIRCSAAGFGQLIDFYGGRKDLSAGSIRVLHDQSFIDDPTRILRAVRFEQRFGFRIEPRTLRLLKEAAGRHMLAAVQPQRLRDELVLMLKEEKAVEMIARLSSLAGFAFLHPKVKVTAGLLRVMRGIRREAAWFRGHCSPARALEEWVMYLAALLSGLNAAQARNCCDRFGFGKAERERALAFVAASCRASLLEGDPPAPRLFRFLEPLPYEAILLLKAAGNAGVKRNIERFFYTCHGTCVEISGHDLKRLGIEPGPEYRRIFRRLLDARLSGRLRSREQELEFVEKMRARCCPGARNGKEESDEER